MAATPLAAEPSNLYARNRTTSDTGTQKMTIYCATPRPKLSQNYNLPFPTPRLGKNGHENGQAVPDAGFTSIKQKKPIPQNVDDSATRSFILLGLIFGAAILCLGLVYLNFPKLLPEEKQYIQLPRNIEDAKNLGTVLQKYKDRHYFIVLSGYFTTYIFLQSFAIPGSIFLSILSGFLFPFPLALSLVCLCSGVGASICYLLSYLVGRRLVWKYIPERAAEWATHVQKHKEHLLNYIIFLRITPFLPNWFINITSPVINVPLGPFFLGTFLGVAAPSFVAIQAGTTLNKLSSSSDALSWNSLIVLAVLAVLSLLPVFFKNKLRAKFD